MSDHDPINELTDVVDLFGAGAGRAESSPVVDDGLPPLPWDDSEGVSNNRFVVRVGDLSGAMRQYAREAVEADRAARKPIEDEQVATLLAQRKKIQRYEAGRAAGVPDGWQLVPADPDGGMVYAGSIGRRDQMVDAADVYRAMLAAAPQPPKAAP